jgi:hypothetical protein
MRKSQELTLPIASRGVGSAGLALCEDNQGQVKYIYEHLDVINGAADHSPLNTTDQHRSH